MSSVTSYLHAACPVCWFAQKWPEEHGISCYALCPGFVQTALLESELGKAPGMQDYMATSRFVT